MIFGQSPPLNSKLKKTKQNTSQWLCVAPPMRKACKWVAKVSLLPGVVHGKTIDPSVRLLHRGSGRRWRPEGATQTKQTPNWNALFQPASGRKSWKKICLGWTCLAFEHSSGLEMTFKIGHGKGTSRSLCRDRHPESSERWMPHQMSSPSATRGLNNITCLNKAESTAKMRLMLILGSSDLSVTNPACLACSGEHNSPLVVTWILSVGPAVSIQTGGSDKRCSFLLKQLRAGSFMTWCAEKPQRRSGLQMETTESETRQRGSIGSGACRPQNWRETFPPRLMPSFRGHTSAVPPSAPALPCQHYGTKRLFSSSRKTPLLNPSALLSFFGFCLPPIQTQSLVAI